MKKGSIKAVGIDIGYGDTKVAYDGVLLSPFPSVQGQAVPIAHQEASILAQHPGEKLVDDDGLEWFIGHLATEQLKPRSQMRLRGMTQDEISQGMAFRKRQVLAALAKLFQSETGVVHIALGVGLPVSHMRESSATLKAALLGQHLVKTHDAEFIASIEHIQVMPEPYGGLYRNIMTSKGEVDQRRQPATRSVVNIGTFTIDVAVMNQNGKYDNSRSGTIEAGLHTAQAWAVEHFGAMIHGTPRHDQIERFMMKRQFPIKGAYYSFEDEWHQAMETVIRQTESLLNEKLEAANDIADIYVLGGGADVVINRVQAMYPQASRAENPVSDTAEGYRRWMLAWLRQNA